MLKIEQYLGVNINEPFTYVGCIGTYMITPAGRFVKKRGDTWVSTSDTDLLCRMLENPKGISLTPGDVRYSPASRTNAEFDSHRFSYVGRTPSGKLLLYTEEPTFLTGSCSKADRRSIKAKINSGYQIPEHNYPEVTPGTYVSLLKILS